METFVQSETTQYPDISCALHNSLWHSAEADAHVPFCYSHPDGIKIAVGTSPNQKNKNPPRYSVKQSGYCLLNAPVSSSWSHEESSHIHP